MSETKYSPEEQRLIDKINQYVWYHRIRVQGEVYTTSVVGRLPEIWDFILANLREVDFQNKIVLDIGCRDGLFSLEAERRGAATVHGIDNDVSTGAVEFLIPFFKSKVKMEELNLYELDPSHIGKFDIIMFFGVLYHLRYPYWGLRKITDCLNMDGLLLLESGMLVDDGFTRELELLYCPVENSPYEKTSCTFFNKRGLVTTLQSLGLQLTKSQTLGDEICSAKMDDVRVSRQYFAFKKGSVTPDQQGIINYWNGTHQYHTVEAGIAANLKQAD
jgi:SAM-dependent methyltransferase